MNEPEQDTARRSSRLAPGIYLLSDRPDRERMLTAVEGLCAGAFGPLASEAHEDGAAVFFEGALTGRPAGTTASDAEIVLTRYRSEGLTGVRELDGFFRLLILEGGRAHLVCDVCATRPVYVYWQDGVAALAPSATWFQRQGLAMSLDPQGLYEMFRTNHPVGARSLVREVTRNRPWTLYTIHRDGRLATHRPRSLEKRRDPDLDLDRLAERMRVVNAEVMRDLLEHPLLRGLPVQMALTAGLDSRHILGELLAQGRPPERVTHVRVEEPDFRPVAEMARELDISLWVRRLDELDLRSLTRTWIRRTAGLLHFHQLYLLAAADDPGGPVVALDGNFADLHMSFVELGTPPHRRHYTKSFLPLLFRDFIHHHRRCVEAFRREAAWFSGPGLYRLLGIEITNRAIHYTGGIFPYFDEHVLAFSPGGHRRAFELFRAAPEELTRGKRGRLHMLREHFPRLAGFATAYGEPLADTATLLPRRWPTPGSLLKGLRQRRNRRGDDLPPSLPHDWLRRIPAIREMVTRAVLESALARHGHLRGPAVRSLLSLHRAGAPVGWPLMSLLSCEVGYRILVRGEDPDAVADWLIGESGR